MTLKVFQLWNKVQCALSTCYIPSNKHEAQTLSGYCDVNYWNFSDAWNRRATGNRYLKATSERLDSELTLCGTLDAPGNLTGSLENVLFTFNTLN